MRIAFTGGGTAGHAMANKVIISFLGESDVIYIGSKKGAEFDIFGKELRFFGICTGKLRRYFSLDNVRDFFGVMVGIWQAFWILKNQGVNVIFSGGGYVAFPVVFAGWLLGIPVIIREPDFSMGLANRWCARFASKIYTTFEDTLSELEGLGFEGECGGLIVRRELILHDDLPKNRAKPRLLVMGGSLGSRSINEVIWDNIELLCERYYVVHIVGKGNGKVLEVGDYVQLEYCDDMGRLYFDSDIVITRCGANAISECLALGKRMVCIPLPSKSSRGEQFMNARFGIAHGCGVMLEEGGLCFDGLIEAIERVLVLPLRSDFVMGEEDLRRGCMNIIRKIYDLGFKNLEEGMAKKIERCHKIDWEALSPWEIQLYEDLMEFYC